MIPGVRHLDHYDLNRSLATNGQDGTYVIQLPKQALPRVVQVEADGYYPEISRSFEERQEEDTADFALDRGEPVTGLVRAPDGQAATNAEVALCAATEGVILGKARFVDPDRSNIAATDAQGRFLFQPRRDAKIVAATHEQGYAEMRFEEFQRSKVVRLKPWGRVAGVLELGGHKGTNELIQLVRLGSLGPLLALNSFTTLTDAEGRFALDDVPPDQLLIGRFIHSQFSHGRLIQVLPGDTTQVALGGNGRTVIGRVAAADGRELDWDSAQPPAFLHPKQPPPAIPPSGDAGSTNAWLRAFWNSDEGKARQVADVHYVLQIDAGGAFHVENVPAGSYECEIHYHEPAPQSGEPDVCRGILRKEIEVAPLLANHPALPCDLGTLTIVLNEPVH